MSSVGVAAFSSKRCHFHLFVFKQDDYYAEFCSNLQRARKQFYYVLWFGVCGNVVILCAASQEHIADTAASQQGLEAVTP
jgi:hypothetical protein